MTTAKCFTLTRTYSPDCVAVQQCGLDGATKDLVPYMRMSLPQAVLHSLMMLPQRDADIFVSQRTSDIVDIFVRYRS